MTANENSPEGPEADLARSRQQIKEAKEAAQDADLRDPVEGDDGEVPVTDPPYHHGEQASPPSVTWPAFTLFSLPGRSFPDRSGALPFRESGGKLPYLSSGGYTPPKNADHCATCHT